MRTVILAGLVVSACAHAPTPKERETAKIHYDIAVAEMKKGDMRAALRDLLTAVESDPELPQAHNALGLVYHALGRMDESLAHYQKAVALKPDFSDAHNNLGTLLVALGRYDEAVGAFKKALEDILYPTPYLAEGNMGWAFYKKGDTPTGIKHLRNATATNPKFCRGYEWLSRIGLHTEDTELVLDNCRRVERYCFNDAELASQLPGGFRMEMAYYCGLGHLKGGDREAARASFELCADDTAEGLPKRCAESLKGM